jgi:phosphonoacetaldehyde hydrolase
MSSRGPITGVILDWAGTTVDFGSLAPVEAFRATFAQRGVEITIAEARAPMGLNKRDHIRTITKMERVEKAWLAKHGGIPGEQDVEAMYHAFVPIQMGVIRDYGHVIDGVLDAVAFFRERGMKVGSTTGYSREMMDVLEPVAAEQGFAPDAIVCASDVPTGRPTPFMAWLNGIKLGLYPMTNMIKIGDTIADIAEGRNAGMWTIGLTKCGNELGLSKAEADALPPSELQARLAAADKRYAAAGAHYTAATLIDALPLIEKIEARLAAGEGP